MRTSVAQRRKSGDGDAVCEPRRNEGRIRAPIAFSATPPAKTMQSMAPQAPRQQASNAPSRSFLQNKRSAKVQKANEALAGCNIPDRCSNSMYTAERDGREETPRSIVPAMKEKLLQESGAFLQEKLMYDELFRHLRSRSEDMTKLQAIMLDMEGNQTEKCGFDTFFQTSRFREEWRIGREDEILGKLELEDRALNRSRLEDDDIKSRTLRAHLIAQNKTKRSQNLLYAQQMDRILSIIEIQAPFIVMRQAILNARCRFQSLLARDATTLCAAIDIHQREPHSKSPDTNSTVSEETNQPELLQLYENVITAKQVAKVVVGQETQAQNGARLELVMETNPKFLADLQIQRAIAEHARNEIQAEAYLRHVSANRIKRGYVKYRRRKEWRTRAEALRQRVETRAMLLLRLRIPSVYKLYQYKRRLLHKHQGRRIAAFCFWKYIYPIRCGFRDYRFDRNVNAALIAAVVRIQSFVRQIQAQHRASLRKSVSSLKVRRALSWKWKRHQHLGKHIHSIDTDLVEWRCRISLEQNRVQEEIARERSRFALEWKKYETKLLKEIMKSKLSPEWIPQMDQISGEEYFLNIKTTKTSKEHPNKVLFKQLVSKQYARAEAIYSEQITRLEVYQQHLAMQLEGHVQASLDAIISKMVLSRYNLTSTTITHAE